MHASADSHDFTYLNHQARQSRAVSTSTAVP